MEQGWGTLQTFIAKCPSEEDKVYRALAALLLRLLFAHALVDRGCRAILVRSRNMDSVPEGRDHERRGPAVGPWQWSGNLSDHPHYKNQVTASLYPLHLG